MQGRDSVQLSPPGHSAYIHCRVFYVAFRKNARLFKESWFVVTIRNRPWGKPRTRQALEWEGQHPATWCSNIKYNQLCRQSQWCPDLMGGHQKSNSEKGTENAYKQVQISSLQIQQSLVTSSWILLHSRESNNAYPIRRLITPEPPFCSKGTQQQHKHYAVISSPSEHGEQVWQMPHKVQNVRY